MTRSQELFQKAQALIPGGVNSPVRACRSVHCDPLFVASASGSKITTEDGAVGWGECCTYFPEASRAAKALVDGMAELVIGRDELHTHAIWLLLKEHSWWYGNGAGIASLAAIAGRRKLTAQQFRILS